VAIAAKVNLEIPQGRTFSKVLRWGQPRLAYAKIQSATQDAPCVLTTESPHGMPDGWTFTISNARGMSELNSDSSPDGKPRIYVCTLRDASTIEINDLNAAAFPAYQGGGIITYNVPVDLTGFTGAAQVRASIDSDQVLLSLTTENGGIILDNTAKTITLQATAVQTAGIDWLDGVWDLELTSPGGVVSPVAAGVVKVIREVTR
jgi:hypothetical protein